MVQRDVRGNASKGLVSALCLGSGLTVIVPRTSIVRLASLSPNPCTLGQQVIAFIVSRRHSDYLLIIRTG